MDGLCHHELLHGLQWVKIQLSAEEEDAGAIVLERTEAPRVGFDRLDFRVQSRGPAYLYRHRDGRPGDHGFRLHKHTTPCVRTLSRGDAGEKENGTVWRGGEGDNPERDRISNRGEPSPAAALPGDPGHRASNPAAPPDRIAAEIEAAPGLHANPNLAVGWQIEPRRVQVKPAPRPAILAISRRLSIPSSIRSTPGCRTWKRSFRARTNAISRNASASSTVARWRWSLWN